MAVDVADMALRTANKEAHEEQHSRPGGDYPAHRDRRRRNRAVRAGDTASVRR